MKLSNDYKIESDELNVMIMKKFIPKEGKNAGQEQWRPISYHPNLEFALNSFITRQINGTGLKDIETVVIKINELREFIKEVTNK